MTVARRLLRTGVLTATWLLLLPSLVLLWSAIAPVVPWLRIYATDVVPNGAPWFLLIAIAAFLVASLYQRHGRTGVTRGLRWIAGFTALTAAVVVAQFLYLAYGNGVGIKIDRTLSLRHFSDAGAPDDSHVYASPGGEPLWLDVYRPPSARRTTPSPVLVAVHGGGFVEGTRRLGAANMRHYARQGWTVISIDYRLARPGRPTWNLATHDVHCALAWIGQRAAPLGIDLDRVTLSGASAGGHLAMAAAYSIVAGRADTACGAKVPRVAAVVVKAPLIDPLGSWRNPGELQGLQRAYMRRYLGGSPERYPERYAALDLRRYADPRNPPTLIMAGRDDPLLPAAAAQEFADRSTAKGAKVSLILFPYSGHDFNTTYGSITNQIVIGAVAQFTAAHGAGPVPTRTGAPTPR